jgi:hypothetical protein
MANGDFIFTVKASNGIGLDDEKAFSITIKTAQDNDDDDNNNSGNNGGSRGNGPSNSDGTTAQPNTDGGKTTVIGGNTIQTPKGQDPVTSSNGSLTVPGGGTITTPGGTVITVPSGTNVSKDGQTVTLPNGESSGSIKQGDNATGVEQGLTISITDNKTPLGGYNLHWINPFTNVYEGDWFYEYVKYVYTHGLISGMTANTYGPQTALTRGMIVTILYNHAGMPNVTGIANPFSDVADNKYYANAVKWAYENNIVSGYGNNLFGPEDNVTRQDLTVILNSYAAFAGIVISEVRAYHGFSDDADIANYAKEAIERFFKAMIINGKGENTFDPTGEAARAEVAAMLMEMLEQVQ